MDNLSNSFVLLRTFCFGQPFLSSNAKKRAKKPQKPETSDTKQKPKKCTQKIKIYWKFS